MAKSAKPVVAATPVVAAPSVLRLPFGEARAHNVTNVFVAGTPVAADVALTSKGTNPKKMRVYGYDNLADGGGVPKDKQVLLVPGFTGTPTGVNEAQWEKLVASAPATVAEHKANGILGRTIRRAYRAGAIRFAA